MYCSDFYLKNDFLAPLEKATIIKRCNQKKIPTPKPKVEKGTSRQRSGKGAIRKRFPLQKPRWKKVQEGKDQENVQSEKDSHSKNRSGKKNKPTIRY